MKVPPKRKGNPARRVGGYRRQGLNESPSEKEGKFHGWNFNLVKAEASMKVPPKRKGNAVEGDRAGELYGASMKVPPKRKGNVMKSYYI